MDAAIMSCLAPLTFADAAMARALHPFSTATMSSSDSSSLSAPAPYGHYSPLLADIPAAAPSPPPTGRRGHSKQLGPAGGRTGKRRSRASKRAPTTYISTDPANFRIMVQQVTGAHADDVLLTLYAAGGPLLPEPGADEASPAAALNISHHQHDLQQPCFPTLDSWNVMYETSTTTNLL